MTPNAPVSPAPGSSQVATNFPNFFINPTVIPPISLTRENLRSAMLDQLAGFQIGLFQQLFPVPQNPDYQTTTFGNTASIAQLQATLVYVNNMKSTILALNQITNTPANRIPADSSIDTDPPYAFLIDNTIIDAANRIALDVINGSSIQTAQLNYATLRDLLNPFYGY